MFVYRAKLAQQRQNLSLGSGIVHQSQIDSSTFLEEGQYEFPFSIELNPNSKRPPSFCLIDQETTDSNDASDSTKSAQKQGVRSKLTLMVNWALKLKIYGKYKLDVLSNHIDSEILKNQQQPKRNGKP